VAPLKSLGELAEELGVHYKTLWRVVTRDMQPPLEQVGGRYIVDGEQEAEVRRLLAERLRRGPGRPPSNRKGEAR